MSCKVSFIGLGVMGYPMAGYISKAGHNVTVYNRTKSKAEKWIKEHRGKIAETPEEAAKRELKEETGLTPIRMFIADHVSTFYEENGDLINLVPVFGIETETKHITLSSEHSEYKWMDFEDAERTLAWNGQKKGMRTVYEMLISNDDRMKWSEIKLK